MIAIAYIMSVMISSSLSQTNMMGMINKYIHSQSQGIAFGTLKVFSAF